MTSTPPTDDARSQEALNWHELAAWALEVSRYLARGRMSPSEVEDVAHESIHALLLKLRDTEISDVRGYLYGILRNKTQRVIQTSARSTYVDVDETTAPSTRAQQQVNWAVFAMRRRLLEVKDQTCLDYFDALRSTLSFRDAASRLAITEAAFRKRHERCRRKLKDWFDRTGLTEFLFSH